MLNRVAEVFIHMYNMHLFGVPIFAGGAGLCGGLLIIVLEEGAIPFFSPYK